MLIARQVCLSFFHFIILIDSPSYEDAPGRSSAEDVVRCGRHSLLFRFVIDERRGIPDSRLVSPFGINSLIKAHHHRILRFEFSVEKAPHVPASTDWVLHSEEI